MEIFKFRKYCVFVTVITAIIYNNYLFIKNIDNKVKLYDYNIFQGIKRWKFYWIE